MLLLYVGQLWEGGTCAERMRALARLGVEPVPFDTTPFSDLGFRLERSLLYRTNTGRGVAGLNRALQALAGSERFDAVWIDKGVWIYPETLSALKRAACRKLAIHYTPDPQLAFHRSRHFNRCIPIYDLLVTTKHFELDAYKTMGARETLMVLQGYGKRFAPSDAFESHSPTLQSDVCFIGHSERHYAQRVKAARAVAGIKVWGPRWPRYARFHPWARSIVQGDGIGGADYPRALRSAKIALGLLSKWIPETTTTRTFEIPATGTFMLAERNDAHRALFEEGKEAEFFASDDELCDKIRFYLGNDAARARIAAAGCARCEKSGYSDAHQLRRVLERMGELLGEPLAGGVHA